MRDVEAERCSIFWLTLMLRVIRDASRVTFNEANTYKDLNASRRFFYPIEDDPKRYFRNICNLNCWDYEGWMDIINNWREDNWCPKTGNKLIKAINVKIREIDENGYG